MRKGYSSVSKVSGAEKARYDHWHRQQGKKQATTVKPGQFAMELRKQLEGTDIAIK